jgi:putative membrane protein
MNMHKKLLTGCALIAGLFTSGALAQSNMQSNMPQQQMPGTSTQQQPTSTSGAQTSGSITEPSAPGAAANQARDKMFLRKATEGGMTEIQFSQVAQQKATSEDVKKFADRMVRDHTMLMQKMEPFAEQYGITPPKTLNKAHMAELDKLNSLSGDDFEKEYISAMVMAHHKDLKDFELEQRATDNNDLKANLDEATKIIARHTGHIDIIAKAHSVPTPPSM